MEVNLRSQDGRYPPPSRYLLECHWAVATILHMTGAAETIERLLRDKEEIRVLASDGSTEFNPMMEVSLNSFRTTFV
jgi:hypothetical protein